MIQIPQPKRKFRWFTLLYALGLLVWFSFEDDSVRSVTLWGLGFAALLVMNWLPKQTALPPIRPAYLPLVTSAFGLMFGLVTNVSTVTLMFFKNALHAHLFPDYPPALMLALLSQAPAWALSGALVGLGGALLFLAVQPNTQAKPHDE